MMQFFNLASARFTFEKTTNPFAKAVQLRKDLKSGKDRPDLKYYWKRVLGFLGFSILIQFLIIQYGGVYAFRTSGLSGNQFLNSLFFGIG